jgi:hypothetical protein
MNRLDSDRVDREGRALIRYLTDAPPSDYLLACYRRGRSRASIDTDLPIDRWLLRAAIRGRLLARLGDGYARLIHPTGGYRRRLTLMVAILENAPTTHLQFNGAIAGSPGLVLARLLANLVLAGVAMIGGLLIFGPLDLVLGRGPAKAS